MPWFVRGACRVNPEEDRHRPEHARRRVPTYRFEWRGAFDNASVNALHAEAFGHELLEYDWEAQFRTHSLDWVCAYGDEDLVGFVNVPWDGGATPSSWTLWSARGRGVRELAHGWSP